MLSPVLHQSPPGRNTTSLLSVIRETDARLPSGLVIVYSERAGGAVKYINMCIFACILCQIYELMLRS